MLPIPPAPERACTLHRPDGAVLAYRVAPPAAGARGAVLVLLHGLASNLSRWSEFVEHSALRGQHALIRLDLRGHGGSVSRGAIGLEVWADDIAAVLDAQGHERAILVGHSLGAQLALHFARRQPQRAAGLVLIDPVFREALHGRWRLLAACAPLLHGAARAVRTLNTLGLRRRRVEPVDLRELDVLARQALASPAAEAAFVRRYSSARADLRHTRSATYLQDLAEMFRAPPDPATLRLPVLALLSGGATFADAAAMREMLARLPDMTLATIACHHWPLTERPAEVRAAIERWCESWCDHAATLREGHPARSVALR
ncbi:alpha/beta fold hydrolase [Methylibium petroleiphilum]|uniref:alpha/beta fold hydrolase n=1 Tax=Methylibium petroleiphilum TaxID=105560 RepID=UPI001ACF027C|nr:alpha/beta hydrolase [Methylibium petroleiphilum]MBN9203654.1 alpha/beta hydrolase [Methylibium petroleiphilum]